MRKERKFASSNLSLKAVYGSYFVCGSSIKCFGTKEVRKFAMEEGVDGYG